MYELIGLLISNKIYLITAALAVSVLIYIILKKVIKIIAILLIAAVVYIAVVSYNGGKLPERIEKINPESIRGVDEFSRFKENILNIIRNSETASKTQSRTSSSE